MRSNKIKNITRLILVCVAIVLLGGAGLGYVAKERFDSAHIAFEKQNYNNEARGGAFETILSLSGVGGFFNGVREYLVKPDAALYDTLIMQYGQFNAALKTLNGTSLSPEVESHVSCLSLAIDEHLVMLERGRAGAATDFEYKIDKSIGDAIRGLALANRKDRVELAEAADHMLEVNRGVYGYAAVLVFMLIVLSYILVTFSRKAAVMYAELDQVNAMAAEANAKLEDRVRQRTRQLRRLNTDLVEQERLLRSTVDALPIAVSYVDSDLFYRRVSKGYEAWTGRPPSAVLGKHVSEILGPRNMKRVGPLIERALKGENVSEDVDFISDNVTTRVLHVDYVPDMDDNGIVHGIHVAFQDVTRQKSAEKAMVQATEEAIRASNSKSSFLAHMSHELRTPLNAVIGFSEAMKLQIFGPLNDRYQGYADNIHSSAQHLLSLISDLLDLSKVEAGKMELAPSEVNILTVMDEIETFIAPLAKSKGITISFNNGVDLGVLRVDRRAILQSVMNIVSNAVKYTASEGKVDVETLYDDRENALIIVKDTGYGISEDELERIQKPFVRGKRALSSATEGTGLGLSLAVAMVKEHGGTVSLESKLGVGTRVTICLPATCVIERGGQPLMGRKNKRTNKSQIIREMFGDN